MDIALLKTFLEVARTRHFGKAADVLFITQSAVSARIKLLESVLAVDLFRRRRNDIQLTPAGMRLVKHAETIVKGWERARNEVGLQGDGAESLAVGGTLDLWGILMREWALKLRRLSPKLVLNVEALPPEVLVTRLVNGLLDLAFLFEPPQIPGLDIRQVADIELVLVSDREAVEVSEALARNYLLVDWGGAFAQIHAANFPEMAAPAARFGNGTLALDMLLAAGGAAYLPRSMVDGHLERRRLFRVSGAPAIGRSAFAVYRLDGPRRELIESTLADLRGNGTPLPAAQARCE